MLSAGLEGLHPTARTAAVVGALLGVALALAEAWLPRRWRPFVPSASGIGLAAVIPGPSSVAMFLGAAIAEGLRRRRPASFGGSPFDSPSLSASFRRA